MSVDPNNWEDFYEAQAESNEEMRAAIRRVENEDEDGATHECLVCGYRCRVSTPHIKVQNWCIPCDGFTRFKRIDKLNDT